MLGIMNHVLRTATLGAQETTTTTSQRDDRIRHEELVRRTQEEKELLRQLGYRRPAL